jgi:predicted RNA-binding Zn-ribbon protein involved in translation (DUF1610 family)
MGMNMKGEHCPNCGEELEDGQIGLCEDCTGSESEFNAKHGDEPDTAEGLLRELIEWQARMGEFEAPVWARAKAYLNGQAGRATPNPTDEEIAHSEGWGLFEASNGEEQIQRDDEADVFSNDDEARAYVRRRAQSGSAAHKRALATHTKHFCAYCGEARDETANSTHQQWECCACGSWNDKEAGK